MMEEDDLDKDGKISELELKSLLGKQSTQRRMAWTSLISMIVFTVMIFLPIIPEERIQLLLELSSMFYVAMASIVGAYMGITAFMSRK